MDFGKVMVGHYKRMANFHREVEKCIFKTHISETSAGGAIEVPKIYKVACLESK